MEKYVYVVMKVAYYEIKLYLEDGYEPFAATTEMHGQAYYDYVWLRKLVQIK